MACTPRRPPDRSRPSKPVRLGVVRSRAEGADAVLVPGGRRPPRHRALFHRRGAAVDPVRSRRARRSALGVRPGPLEAGRWRHRCGPAGRLRVLLAGRGPPARPVQPEGADGLGQDARRDGLRPGAREAAWAPPGDRRPAVPGDHRAERGRLPPGPEPRRRARRRPGAPLRRGRRGGGRRGGHLEGEASGRQRHRELGRPRGRDHRRPVPRVPLLVPARPHQEAPQHREVGRRPRRGPGAPVPPARPGPERPGRPLRPLRRHLAPLHRRRGRPSPGGRRPCPADSPPASAAR